MLLIIFTTSSLVFRATDFWGTEEHKDIFFFTQRRKGRGAMCSFVLLSKILLHTEFCLTEEHKDIFFSRKDAKVAERYALLFFCLK